MPENKRNDARRYEDEITLYDLYSILVEKKVILISAIIFSLLAAVAYLLIVPPTYEAKLRLLVPKPGNLVLSTPSHPYTAFDANTVFQEFQSQITLLEQWRQFVTSNPALFSSETGISMNNLLQEHPIKLSKDKSNPIEHAYVAFQDENPSRSASVLSHYLEFTRDAYVNDLVDQVNDRIERQRINISADIAMLRQKARLHREDEIERLRQDLNLARALGIVENLLVRSGDAARNGSDITIIAANGTLRSYMRGTRVLNAELDSLLKRESDDPYIDDLRGKRIELERLNSLQITSSQFKPYLQDGEIAIPIAPIKPRKKQILLLSTVAGVVLGLILVFIAHAFQRSRAFAKT